METTNTQIQTIDNFALSISNRANKWLMDDVGKNAFTVPEGYDISREIPSAVQSLKANGLLDKFKNNAETVLYALRDMAINGLSYSRNQCYFIPYGSTLQMRRSYFGGKAQFERIFPEYEVNAMAIFKGDEYRVAYLEEGNFRYLSDFTPSQSLDSLSADNVVGAYCTIRDKRNRHLIYAEIMSIAQIEKAWRQGNNSKEKNNATQTNFKEEMAKRTVFNRCVKMYINSANSEADPEAIRRFRVLTESDYEAQYEEKPSAASFEDAIGLTPEGEIIG